MNKKELIDTLNIFNGHQVLVKIENGLYYPIIKVYREKSGEIVLLCRDIASVSVMKPAKLDLDK